MQEIISQRISSLTESMNCSRFPSLPYQILSSPSNIWKFRRYILHVYVCLLQGYNGSQLWDTAFAVQAIMSTKLAEEYGTTLRKAHKYIKDSQVLISRISYQLHAFFVCIQVFSFLLYRSQKIVLGIYKIGIVIFRKVHGHFQLQIMDGPSLTVLLKV